MTPLVTIVDADDVASVEDYLAAEAAVARRMSPDADAASDVPLAGGNTPVFLFSSME